MLIQHTLLDVVAIDALHPDALINYTQVARGKRERRGREREIEAVFLLGSGDATDQLFHVNSASEANPGRVTVTGTLDRETENTHTINIQVRITLSRS